MRKLPELPDHVLNLAREILNGNPVEPMLADALEELGLVECSSHYRPENFGSRDHTPETGMCSVAEMLVGRHAPEPSHSYYRFWTEIRHYREQA